ncbi:hypothetical protein ACX27_04320 [Nostoc piscinale CENA21]|uniref:Uncharacterized protein n=1 Tax=Nostoc piscinale CENA21 TaxID=224013 RepID=A0A0M4T1S3_9NOSO|nr:hypothetical protein [Nostoc piscinale]ALF52254.1 hypothetical protein ACX27_04320 [Nostoc piscinale CENA21]
MIVNSNKINSETIKAIITKDGDRMAKFIKCSCENAKYNSYSQHNSPVNIDLACQIVKGRANAYPDNQGAPTIAFVGINIEWVYEKEEDRDADYEMILQKFG